MSRYVHWSLSSIGGAELRVREVEPGVAVHGRDAGHRSILGSPATRRVLLASVVALVAVPLVLELFALIGKTWSPASDRALTVLRVEDVGGSHTPLVGAYSRYGWYHPGPILFWILAAPFRILGENGVLAGAVLINLAACVAAVVVAIRRGGLPLAIVTAAAIALLCHAMGPELLMDPWNPWACVIAFFVYTLLIWSVAERDWTMLPWAVGAGSFVVQCHFGYAPLVLGLAGVAAVLAWRRRSAGPSAEDERPSPSGLRRPVVYAGLVAVVLWLPPVIQQFTGHPGNLGDLVNAVRDPNGHPAGLANGFGLMGTELDVPGPLFHGNDRGFMQVVPPGSTTRALFLVATAALLGWWAHRRGGDSAARLAVLAVSGAGLGVLAASRITGWVAPYLLRWSWIVALLLYVSCAWSLWAIVRRIDVVAVGFMAVLGAFAILVTVMNVGTAVATDTPFPEDSRIVERLASQTMRRIDRGDRYLVRWVERDFLKGIGAGMLLELHDRGLDVRVPKRFAHSFAHRYGGSETTTDATIRIVGAAGETPALPGPGEVEVASVDPLTAREKARVHDLRALVDAAISGPCGQKGSFRCAARVLESSKELTAAANELGVLAQRGDSYRVFVAGHP